MLLNRWTNTSSYHGATVDRFVGRFGRKLRDFGGETKPNAEYMLSSSEIPSTNWTDLLGDGFALAEDGFLGRGSFGRQNGGRIRIFVGQWKLGQADLDRNVGRMDGFVEEL